MGDRAIVQFKDSNTGDDDMMPIVYLHWGGSSVPGLLKELVVLMANRTDDAAYATARFIGLAHVSSVGNLSLGCWSEAGRPDHGDTGNWLVDTRDWTVNRQGWVEGDFNISDL